MTGNGGQSGKGAITIVYATRDGQSARIATHIEARLRSGGATPAMRRLVRDSPPAADAGGDALVAVLAVRYGRILAEGEQFLAAYARRPSPPPLALGVVNLVARDPSRRTPETNPYLRKALDRHALRPAIAAAIGGRLNYPKYRFFDRQMIRLIMAMTGGVADGVSDIEFTDWTQVDAFAADALALAQGARVGE